MLEAGSGRLSTVVFTAVTHQSRGNLVLYLEVLLRLWVSSASCIHEFLVVICIFYILDLSQDLTSS